MIPAPCAFTLHVGTITAAGAVVEQERRLVVGWNGDGSPIVVGDDGALRLLLPGEAVTALVWSE